MNQLDLINKEFQSGRTVFITFCVKNKTKKITTNKHKYYLKPKTNKLTLATGIPYQLIRIEMTNIIILLLNCFITNNDYEIIGIAISYI